MRMVPSPDNGKCKLIREKSKSSVFNELNAVAGGGIGISVINTSQQRDLAFEVARTKPEVTARGSTR
jgi:hypothetical protein